MASSSNHRATTVGSRLVVLLPFTRDSLRIPVEFAEGIVAVEVVVVGLTSGGGATAAWNVEIGWDDAGAFLGSGWPEFAGACGVEEGWHLILRYRGNGVLTVEAFDATGCLSERELVGATTGPVPPAVEVMVSSKCQKPQFIRVLSSGAFHENLLIPPMFVHKYIRNEHLNNDTATVFGPLGKVSHIKLHKIGSDVLFVGGWSPFLVFNNITEGDILLFIYDGKMEFTVRVFDPEGYLRDYKHKETIAQQGEEKDKYATSSDTEEQVQQEAPSASFQKHCKNTKGQGAMVKRNRKGLWTKAIYKIGPQLLSMKKKINCNTLRELALAKRFCAALGLDGGTSTVTIKTSMSNTNSWQVKAVACKNMSYRLLKGWRRFFLDNSLKLGDICTFKVMENKLLWDVTINHLSYETSSSSSRKHNIMNHKTSGKGQKRLKSSVNSLKMTSTTRGCVFDFGPPAWIRKEINSTIVATRLYLPPVFCKAIGIQEPCTVTLKASMDSTRSWQVNVSPHEGSSHHVSGPGWRQFCMENGIKVGDVCTIDIAETKLWHVTISSPNQ